MNYAQFMLHQLKKHHAFLCSCGGPVILEVEKITANTYATETTYENEEFILLDIYPKTNGTVSVSYGGLTKTITDTSGEAEPNAQQVFFGTYNGVSDSVTTPASGTLTIEGDCRGFGISQYKVAKLEYNEWNGITEVINFGNVEFIPDAAIGGAYSSCDKIAVIKIPSSVTSIGRDAFRGCTGLTSVTIPSSVTSIGIYVFYGCSSLVNIIVGNNNNHYCAENGILFSKDKTRLISYPTASGNCIIPSGATSIDVGAFASTGLTSVTIPSSVTIIGHSAFSSCTGLTSVTIPSSVTSISEYAFERCTGLTSVTIPSSVTSISKYAFSYCTGLTSVTFNNTSGWYVTETENGDASTGTTVDVTDTVNNVTLITDTYKGYYWCRS